ncbi:phosphosulfolactate synthase [Alicyclobacillus sendaiensis]|uniref:Phosphosulfolactate synthase n=1 Tax=Alicyclobacillus sendaiensis PA2 TaxID=3029425 RepID=A0ABT6XWP9_ALISE|nr:phosphosulfolactate synthase [Alicyclobacillus sendaiensis]MDI9259514.1 phosphosulfolactate synthase [Alicyclobacillus sendaiensis PA2]
MDARWNNVLSLPQRPEKPREKGITVVIDNGVPVSWFRDAMESNGAWIDGVKFGWGTALVTPRLEEKVEVLNRLGIPYFFGGTLFEKFLIQGRIDDYEAMCLHYGCRDVEISNGTVPLANAEKARFIERFARRFRVWSEVGYKDVKQSLLLPPHRWIQFIREDLAAGASYVITEARESGTSGICRENGELRFGLIEEILEASLDTNRLVFEAPNKTLQKYFIDKLGPNVNLGNVAIGDAIPLETLRRGLRSDTLLQFETGDVPLSDAEPALWHS